MVVNAYPNHFVPFLVISYPAKMDGWMDGWIDERTDRRVLIELTLTLACLPITRMRNGIRTISLPDEIPSAHFCIGGHNPFRDFCNVDIIPPPRSFLQGGQNPFCEFSN